MENDKNDINNNEKLISTDIYKIEFSGQKLDNNNKFLNWKKDMINLYGNNLKLIKCKKDNIYFCIDEKKINHDDEDIYIYRYKCPLCNKYICPDCQKAFSRNDEDCCIKGRIKTIIFEGPKFGVDIFEPVMENTNSYHNLKRNSNYWIELCDELANLCKNQIKEIEGVHKRDVQVTLD